METEMVKVIISILSSLEPHIKEPIHAALRNFHLDIIVTSIIMKTDDKSVLISKLSFY